MARATQNRSGGRPNHAMEHSPSRRFPAPWSAEPQPNYYVVRDADGQQLAYIYYSNDPERRSAVKLLTKDEARRIAANIAKLPEPLSRHKTWGVR